MEQGKKTMTLRHKLALAGTTCLALLATACATDSGGADFAIDFERYELANGLEVILHVDDSDPLAAVAMTFHVGSAREVEGRTGFAHLFEHLFFLDSENLGSGGLDRLMTRVGSSTNGSTSRDRTNYFEVVPIDGLEKAIWAEADKLGFFINTVTESVMAKEKQVVKNEKRQSVDNRPYGHNEYVIDQAMYPRGHSYRWQVIGSLADLDAATIEDAKEFHARWYGPGNATLVVAGALDVASTKAWIEKYFGEIPAREIPTTPDPPEVLLANTPRLYHEDNFGNLPLLTLSWPTVPRYHPDAYALDVLARLLTDGKSTPLYKVLVEEEELTPQVSTFHRPQELAGQFNFQSLAYAGKDLDDLLAAVEAGLQRFEEEGVPGSELRRIKAGTETGFYRGLSSAIGKAFQLADYAIFAGDPGYAGEDLQRILDVSADDVMRVYQTYLKDQPYVASSFVPRGQVELALEGSERAEVVIEPIVQGAEAAFTVVRGEERTPAGSFDRSVEPPYGPSPTFRAPEVWRETLANGLSVLGVEDRETPMVQFELDFRGGMLVEAQGRTGVANLLAQTMMEGTAERTPAELEEAIDLLGASLSVSAGNTGFSISGSVMARNYDETMALVEEILMEPRFDSDRFELARQRVLNQIRQLGANPSFVASQAFDRLLYGDHILAESSVGTLDGVGALTLDDLRAYHASALVPGRGRLPCRGGGVAGRCHRPAGRARRTVAGPPRARPPGSPRLVRRPRGPVLHRRSRRRPVRRQRRPPRAGTHRRRLPPRHRHELPPGWRRLRIRPDPGPARREGVHLRGRIALRRRPLPGTLQHQQLGALQRHPGVARNHQGHAGDLRPHLRRRGSGGHAGLPATFQRPRLRDARRQARGGARRERLRLRAGLRAAAGADRARHDGGARGGAGGAVPGRQHDLARRRGRGHADGPSRGAGTGCARPAGSVGQACWLN